MEFKIEKDQFLKSLQKIQGIVEKRTSTLILHLRCVVLPPVLAPHYALPDPTPLGSISQFPVIDKM